MKVRIGLNGKKSKDKDTVNTDSSQCTPTGIRILLSVYSMKKGPLGETDFTRAFLQTGSSKRDAYVVPPREWRRKSFYLLL